MLEQLAYTAGRNSCVKLVTYSSQGEKPHNESYYRFTIALWIIYIKRRYLDISPSLFMGKSYSKLNHNKMEKKDAISELPLADGSVISKIQQKNNDVPDQPYGWQGTMEYSPLFEPMEEEDEEREKREEEGEGEEKRREEIEE